MIYIDRLRKRKVYKEIIGDIELSPIDVIISEFYFEYVLSKNKKVKDNDYKILSHILTHKENWKRAIIYVAHNTHGCTLRRFISLYGRKEGKLKLESHHEKVEYAKTLPYYEKKYGEVEGKIRYDKLNKKRGVTLENQISKYGEVEGKIRYDKYCDRQSYTNSEEYYVSKYGKEHGKEKYKEWKLSLATSIENFTKKYGEVEGKIRYDKVITNAYTAHSKISQELFRFIYDNLDETLKPHTYYGELNKEFGKHTSLGYVKYDFTITSIKFCIEFNGDKWHMNPKTHKPNQIRKMRGDTQNITAKEIWDKDKFKEDLLTNEKWVHVTVWESDYLKDKKAVIKNMLDIIDKTIKEYDDRN